MKIILASDHRGFDLKESIKKVLISNGYDIEDIGPDIKDENDDYPKIILPAAMKVLNNPESTRAIVFGKSGQGEAMICNRLPGVRAVVYYSPNLEIIKLSREHNDSNVLSIGAEFIDLENALTAINKWIEHPFSGDERHIRRIEMLDNIQ